jgi:translation initiation factor 2 beta subunit (eIF-2beta)/eIF-5
MTPENKILYSFLKFSITELETQLKDLKTSLKGNEDFNDTLEYDKKIVVLKDLKEQLEKLEKE